MKILGIETSCDESAVCLIDAQGDFDFASPKLHAKAGNNFQFQVLGNSLISQIAIHAQYGGVFPNLAKREHAKNLVPLLEQTLQQAETLLRGDASQKVTIAELQIILAREPDLYERLIVFLQKYAKPEIDAIAVTVGPGLEPALWVGINFARALNLVWNIPLVAVNHMEGHIVMSLMRHDNFQFTIPNFQKETHTPKRCALNAVRYPLLSLLISGGHTELVLSSKWHDYKIVGATRDDAVGEAFDKVARLLGLPYPGGPHISALAEMSRNNAEQTRKHAEKVPHRSASVSHGSAFHLPRPMLHDDTLDFSFAGLKTAVLRIVQAHSPLTDEMKSRIALEFEDAVTDVLVAKTMKAVDEYGIQTVLVGGGVSANTHIRAQLATQLATVDCKLLTPPPELATDNALMIALAGYFRAQNREFVNPDMLKANGNLKLA
ncbi:MAG: tRNA (adenosine(37)-N6)-threonylcarbamoyltransferase complex transferase subunit TsaD [bacterium]|nr:tRNA (adenosine(37)-N6)-threonylcarbamoyltransferase complex transferase subunit TsaD [bacterium]